MHSLRERLTRGLDWGSVLVFMLGLWTITGSLWFLFGWGSDELRLTIADFGNIPLSGAAAVLAWRAARQSERGTKPRRAWNIVGWAFLCTAIGDILWLFYEKILGLDPFPSWADLPYLLNYPVLFVGLMHFPGVVRTAQEKVQFVLDTATVLLGSWMIVWHFVIEPIASATGAGPLEAAITVAYPLGDMMLLGGVTIILLTRGPVGRTSALRVMATGIFTYVVGDMVFSYLQMHDLYQSGTWTEPFWFVTSFLNGYSAHLQYKQLRQSGRSEEPVPSGRPFSTLPYAAVILSYALVLSVARDEVSGGALDELIYGAVGITLLVMARQFVTARENLRLLAESAVRRSEARFGSLVRNSSDVITIIDEQFTVIYQSPSVERIFGYEAAELTGSKLKGLFHPDEEAHNLAVLQRVVQEPGQHKLVEWRWFHKDGSVRHAETTINNLLADETVRGLVLNTRDITERKRLEAQIRHQAFHDTLTSLANRALFKDRVEQAIYEQSHRLEPITVLFLDLDNFKTINDSLGHSVGDQLLCAVAERLLTCVRSTDTVARLGGDEFAVLLKWMGPDGAQPIASRIASEMKAPFQLQGREVCISVSVGLATSQGGERADELLRNADVAMYCAKARGKGRCEVYHPDMYSAVRERLELEGEMRRAVDAQQFVLYYQPTIDLTSGRVAGVEALVRWYHPQRGIMQPGQFIALAEETDLIIPLGRWVLNQACAQLRLWREKFPGTAPESVGVNLSVKQLNHADLIDHVREALEMAGLPPRALVLEITESVLMHASDLFLERLRALRNLGVQLAIDDFGTGYSSLSYLRWVPADMLKMDKSFLRGIESNGKASSLVQGILNLARALGLETVAEGIERPEQLSELQALHCDLGQGYYFGSPLTAAEVELLWGRKLQPPTSQAAG
ncbi:MAG TPA: EAL domain-containing protein [Symbiobacteriaceae bacterium]|nr:EAL domain-containing protein [Symbiobacteriaceae bacterium]